jgi:alkaline phosphatase D
MMKRRELILRVGLCSGLLLSQLHPSKTGYSAEPSLNPFALGVASGDPYPDSVVLWTRIAPDPLGSNPVPTAAIAVQWRVAKDEAMTQIIAKGEAIALPELACTVHVVVDGLDPGQWYWYQFQVGSVISPVGRTRTAPAVASSPEQVKFALVSCQNYEHGYFNAYRHMLQDDLEFVVHVGDYIYEGGGIPKPNNPRLHATQGAEDLDGYRRRYAQYRLDRDLQEAHRLFPFICIWDDHEVENDYANDQSQKFADPQSFRLRRAAAYQAYYEHLPLRPESKPKGADLQLYRSFQFGDLMGLNLLDGRQYRDDQVCGEGKGGGKVINCPERLDPARSLLGASQEAWLAAQLKQSKSLWNVIAQQYLVSELKQGDGYWSDGWDGYPAARERLLKLLQAEKISRPIFLGGDIHSFWVSDLKLDYQDPSSPVIASEFVGTSVSSDGISYDLVQAFLPQNPHIKFFESRLRGYVRCTVMRDRWRSDLLVVDTVKQPQSSLQTLASFEVDANQLGVKRV